MEFSHYRAWARRFKNATINLCVFAAPGADMARLQDDLVYDWRPEFSGGASIVIFAVRRRIVEGVTRLSSDLSGTGVSGLGDRVTVKGERGTSPVPCLCRFRRRWRRPRRWP
jgi:hypothetical protein